MSYMANRIIQGILVLGDRKFTEKRYIEKVRGVEVEKVTIYVKFTAVEFFKIKTSMDDDPDTEQQFISEEDASAWI